jgi:predicted RNA-binding protein associated with RNAse of E/G family
VVVFRSIYRGRLVYAVPGWLVEDAPTHVVTATVPGALCQFPAGPRSNNLREIAEGRLTLIDHVWHTNRILWLSPLGAPYAIGHVWEDATDAFTGYYVNLQEPLRRSRDGFDSLDQVLDILVEPDGRTWHWKDQDELIDAVRVGMFTQHEADAIRRTGERVIQDLPGLLPTGWETWRPDPAWGPLSRPPGA